MGKIRVIDHHITTSLSVKELAVGFRDNLCNPRGLLGLAGRALLDWDFFTPQKSDDPFADLEPSEPPTFSAAASYGLKQRSRITTFEQALNASVGGGMFLQVWDEGSRRRVELRHLGDLSPASKRCVQNVISSWRQGDPHLHESETRGKIHG